MVVRDLMTSKEAVKLIGEALGIDLDKDTDVIIHLPLRGCVRIEREHYLKKNTVDE